MEDIFKTESRLRKRLIELSETLDRETIRSIIDYFGSDLKDYYINNVNSQYMVESRAEVIDKYEKEDHVKKLIKGNEIVKKYNVFPGDIFTNPEDTRQSIFDYDYYIRPRTRTQYLKEEEEARSGKSGRMPMDDGDSEKKKEDAPSLDD